MFSIPMSAASEELPIKPETAKKVAAAEAAHATAVAAQETADEFQKIATKAIADEADPLADTSKINIRAQAESMMETTIQSLKKLNSPKDDADPAR